MNKINFLIVSLFSNNIKSVKLISRYKDDVYRHKPNAALIPKRLENEQDFEYCMRNSNEISSMTLRLFITEIRNLENESTFDIEEKTSNANKSIKHEYILKKENNLISIKRNSRDVFAPDVTIKNNYNSPYDINYTILALLNMKNIKSFLNGKEAAHRDYPNFYIYDNYCFAINITDSSYYIFESNHINDMKNREEIKNLFGKKEINKYDKVIKFIKDWAIVSIIITIPSIILNFILIIRQF